MSKRMITADERAKLAGVRVSDKHSSSYIREDMGYGITQVNCKCGEPLRTMQVVEDAVRTLQSKGQRVLVQRERLRNLPAYTEMSLEFDDGSRHVTPVCRSCAIGVTPEIANKYYLMDLLRWADQELDWGHLINRKVTKVLG